MNKVSNGLDFRQDYCQFLIVSQKNFTQTYFAEHTKNYSHDQINRYLKSDHISSADIWTEAKAHIIPSNKGYLLMILLLIKTTLPKLKWFVASRAAIQAESSRE